MSTIDDTLVEGVEQVTIIMSTATIAELIDEMIDISEDTVVFIEDNDGMLDYLVTCMHVYVMLYYMHVIIQVNAHGSPGHCERLILGRTFNLVLKPLNH